MGYKIRYGGEIHLSQTGKVKKSATFKIFVCFLCVLMIAVWGRRRIADWLIPGDNAVTKEAFSEFNSALDEGESFGDAFEVFCREIIYSEEDS